MRVTGDATSIACPLRVQAGPLGTKPDRALSAGPRVARPARPAPMPQSECRRLPVAATAPQPRVCSRQTGHGVIRKHDPGDPCEEKAGGYGSKDGRQFGRLAAAGNGHWQDSGTDQRWIAPSGRRSAGATTQEHVEHRRQQQGVEVWTEREDVVLPHRRDDLRTRREEITFRTPYTLAERDAGLAPQAGGHSCGEMPVCQARQVEWRSKTWGFGLNEALENAVVELALVVQRLLEQA